MRCAAVDTNEYLIQDNTHSTAGLPSKHPLMAHGLGEGLAGFTLVEQEQTWSMGACSTALYCPGGGVEPVDEVLDAPKYSYTQRVTVGRTA
jgi:hypothetical protein